MTTTPINIEIDGESILDDMLDVSINMAEDAFTLSIDISFTGNRLFERCNPKTRRGQLRVKASIGSTSYQFLIEDRQASSSDGVAFTIWGRSAQALLSAPYADVIRDTEETEHPWQEGNTTFSAIISHVVANYSDFSEGVTLSADDFPVYLYSLSVDGQTPLEVIRTLADAAGYVLRAEIDGSLVIDTFETSGSSVETYNDLDDLIQIDESILEPSGFNAIAITGRMGGGAYIQAELYRDPSAEEAVDCMQITDFADLSDPASDTIYAKKRFRIRVYYRHPSLVPLFYSDSVSGTGNLIVQEGSGVEERWEYVDLTWGSGSTKYPDLAGNTAVEGDPSIPMERKLVHYYTRYVDFGVRVDTPSDTNDPDDPGYSIMFYFADKSTYSVFSFQAEVAIEDDWGLDKSVVIERVDSEDPGAGEAETVYQYETDFYLRESANMFSARNAAARTRAGSGANAPAGDPLVTSQGVTASLATNYFSGQHPISQGRTVYYRVFPAGHVARITTSAGSGAIAKQGSGTLTVSGEEVNFVNGVAWLKYPIASAPSVLFSGSLGNVQVQSKKNSARLYVADFRGQMETAYVSARVSYEAEYDLYRAEIPEEWASNRFLTFCCFSGVAAPTVVELSLDELKSTLDIQSEGSNVRTGDSAGGSVRAINFVGDGVTVTDLGNRTVEVEIEGGGSGGGGGIWTRDFDNWQCGVNCNPSGGTFVENGPGMTLDRIGNMDPNWTKIKITGTVTSGATVQAWNVGSTSFISWSNVSSGDELTINWGGLTPGDRLDVYGFSVVTNIEVYIPVS